MNISSIARSYASGSLLREDTAEQIAELDFPVYNTDTDGKYLVSGYQENSVSNLSELLGLGVLTPEQYDDLLDMIPEPSEEQTTTYENSWKEN